MPYDHRNGTPDGFSSKTTKSVLADLNHKDFRDICVVGSGGGTVGYFAHGTTTDYMYDVAKVPVDFTFEIYGDSSEPATDCFRMFNPADSVTFKVRKKKSQLSKLKKAIQEGKEYERRKLEQLAMEILVEIAYKRLLGGRGGSSHKSGASKVSKQLAWAFAKRTIAIYHVFERKAFGAMTCGVSSNVIERHEPDHKIERGSFVPIQGHSEQTFGKNDSVCNGVKKREVLVDEIVKNAASRTMPTLNDTL